jgi:hypothetical protein
MDAFTEEHLMKWLKYTIPLGDRQKVERQIRWMLKEHPELIELGWSWPEIRSLAERSDKV